MAHFYSTLYFYYVMPITKIYKQQSTGSEVSTYSNDYTTNGTDTYTFTYSKTEVIWTKGGYHAPGMKSPPMTMFRITSDLQDYEIDYISVGLSLSSYGPKAPSSGSSTYTATASRLNSGSIQRVYIYLKYKNAFEIPLTSSGATTCKTAQKYCDKNIIVYPKLQEKNATPTSESQAITADSGYAGLSKVTVAAVPTETKSVTPTTSAQEITPTSGKFLSKVTVAATPLQTKAGVPGKVSKTYTPDAGYVGLESFQIEAVPTKDETIVSNGTFSPDAGTFFGDITVNVPPYENVTTSAEMEAKLVAANVGKVYRADFTNDTYTFGDLYEVVSE